MIKSSWKRSGSSFQWNITTPCNTTATVYIPASSKSLVTESGQALSSKDVKFVKMDGVYTVFEVGSGSYEFLAKHKI